MHETRAAIARGGGRTTRVTAHKKGSGAYPPGPEFGCCTTSVTKDPAVVRRTLHVECCTRPTALFSSAGLRVSSSRMGAIHEDGQPGEIGQYLAAIPRIVCLQHQPRYLLRRCFNADVDDPRHREWQQSGIASCLQTGDRPKAARPGFIDEDKRAPHLQPPAPDALHRELRRVLVDAHCCLSRYLTANRSDSHTTPPLPRR